MCPSSRTVGYFDGLCEPVNPGGIATYGYVIYDKEGNAVAKGCGIAAAGLVGEYATNNVAEYAGVIALLKRLKELRIENPLIRGNSRLVIKQLTGEFKVKSPHLIPLYLEAKELADEVGASFEWVPRGKNSVADKLSRIAYEEFVRRNLNAFLKYYSNYVATPKQLSLLKKLGVDVPPWVGRREASRRISDRLRKAVRSGDDY